MLLRLEKVYGVCIGKTARLGRNLKLRHPVGIVIGDGVEIGDNVTIYQQVTLGGARIGDGKLGNYPSVGDGTVIFTGAKIIGGIAVGKNCVIGANAVVTENVPDNHIAVGVPAKNRARNDEEN